MGEFLTPEVILGAVALVAILAASTALGIAAGFHQTLMDIKSEVTNDESDRQSNN